MLPLTTNGAIVLDQNAYNSQYNATATISGGSIGRTQTFTVGVAGILAAVEIELVGAAPQQLRILQTTAGAPIGGSSGSIVLAESFDFSSNSTHYTFDLSGSNLAVNLGDILAIEPIASGRSEWAGSIPDVYSGGSDFFYNTRASIYDWRINNKLDFNFRTYVEDGVSVPELSPLTLFIIGLSSFFLIRWGPIRTNNTIQKGCLHFLLAMLLLTTSPNSNAATIRFENLAKGLPVNFVQLDFKFTFTKIMEAGVAEAGKSGQGLYLEKSPYAILTFRIDTVDGSLFKLERLDVFSNNIDFVMTVSGTFNTKDGTVLSQSISTNNNWQTIVNGVVFDEYFDFLNINLKYEGAGAGPAFFMPIAEYEKMYLDNLVLTSLDVPELAPLSLVSVGLSCLTWVRFGRVM